VTPDIAVFGKALSAGLPLSAMAGKRELLELLRNDRVLVGGTFNSFPIGIAAAVASIRMLERDDQAYYKAVDARQEQIVKGLKDIARHHNRPLLLQGPRGLQFMALMDREVVYNPAELRPAFGPEMNRLRQLLAAEGVLIAPGSRLFISGALADDDVTAILRGFDQALAKL
jgi:glutamate-1-semialdehyde 2,1-aminomutase